MTKKKQVLISIVIVSFSLLLIIIIKQIIFQTKRISLPTATNEVAPQNLVLTLTPTQAPVNLVFVGDMMFDRHIRAHAKTKGYDYILEDFKDIFSKADLIVANLEGSISNFPSRSVGSKVGSTDNYFFTFEPNILPMLSSYGNFLVNLGNNHIFNFGLEGLKQTLINLDEAQIPYFGYLGDQTPPDYQSHYLLDFDLSNGNQFRLAFINYNQFISGGLEASLAEIESLDSEADFLIVYSHWGVEYQTIANQIIQKQAHQFIDAGADLVIGAHPHVVQQSEVYENKHIYYSLGNFVFDQYFEPSVKRGLLLEIELDLLSKKISINEHKTLLDISGKTKLITD